MSQAQVGGSGRVFCYGGCTGTPPAMSKPGRCRHRVFARPSLAGPPMGTGYAASPIILYPQREEVPACCWLFDIGMTQAAVQMRMLAQLIFSLGAKDGRMPAWGNGRCSRRSHSRRYASRGQPKRLQGRATGAPKLCHKECGCRILERVVCTYNSHGGKFGSPIPGWTFCRMPMPGVSSVMEPGRNVP